VETYNEETTEVKVESGAFRGLLCRGCNLGLGHFEEDPARLVRAAQYLEGCKQ
jgi:hypothetical protein